MTTPPPLAGQHTADVLAEVRRGLSRDEVTKLQQRGVVGRRAMPPDLGRLMHEKIAFGPCAALAR